MSLRMMISRISSGACRGICALYIMAVGISIAICIAPRVHKLRYSLMISYST